jgi:hypothetical protein
VTRRDRRPDGYPTFPHAHPALEGKPEVIATGPARKKENVSYENAYYLNIIQVDSYPYKYTK